MMDDATDLAALLRQVRQALQTEDYASALHGLGRLVALAEAAADWGAAGRHLGNLALTQARIGQLEAALGSFERAIRFARLDDDRVTEAGLLGNMGNALRQAARHAEAERALQQALKLSQGLHDLRGCGLWLSTLGLLYDDLGEPQRARVHHMEAVKIAMQLQDRSHLAVRLLHLGQTLRRMGSGAQALDCFNEAADLFLALDRKAEAAASLRAVADLYAQRARRQAAAPQAADDYAAALEAYRESALLAHEINNVPAQAELACLMGGVLRALGYSSAARQYWLAAASIYAQLNQPDRLAQVNQLLRGL